MGVISTHHFLLILSWSWAGILSIAAATWIYRRYFHPLAKIPGPFLPAVTHLYQFYYCTVGGSRYYAQIEKLHEKYGPVVRINPDEIHLSDPENYEKIYSFGSNFYKAPSFYKAFPGPVSEVFVAESNETHRVLRAILNTRFSRKMILELEDLVQSKAAKLKQRIHKALHAEMSIDLHHGFRAIAVDVITSYAFNNCYNLLECDDFGVQLFSMMQDLGSSFWFFHQFPFVKLFMSKTPMWLAKLTSKPATSLMQVQMDCRDKLKDEVYTSEVTGNAMTITTYNIVSNKDIYRKLTAELKEAFPDPSATLDFLTLEKLPYLTAVIKEGLRLSYGVIGRLPRVTPEPGAEFNGYSVPAGTIVGMSSWMMHRNEAIFPNAGKFDPSRWLYPVTARMLDKYFVPFGKDSRRCLGMPLAYCELYVTLGTIFRHFENLKVDQTRPQDLVYDDYFATYHPKNARKLHVVSE